MDFLDRLRKKPEDKRKMYAFTSAIIITAVIFLMWLVAMVYTSPYTGRVAKVPEPSGGVENQIRPINAFVKNFRTGISEIGRYSLELIQ